MFGVLAVLLTFFLLSFGGVLRYAWFAAAIFLAASAFFVLALRFTRRRKLDTPIIVFLVFSVFIVLMTPARLGVGLIAGGWAYLAAKGGERQTFRFFHFLFVVGLLEAFLGLVQYFLLPGWILGYQNNFYNTSGTLINRNHFAGLLEMLIPVAFGLAYSSMQRFGDLARPYLYLVSGAFMGLALLFSLSRMGIFSFLMTVLFLTTVLQLRKSQRRMALGLGLGIVGFVLAGALWVGSDEIVQRYSQLVGPDATLNDLRIPMYRDTLRMIESTPGGVGTGNFVDRFREYQTFRPDLLVDHAHNDYLETAAEWGLPIAAAFWSFLIFGVIRGVRLFVSIDSPEPRGILLACTGAMFSILVHSLTDFNLQIPSNAMLFFTFAGISLALPLKRAAGDYATLEN